MSELADTLRQARAKLSELDALLAGLESREAAMLSLAGHMRNAVERQGLVHDDGKPDIRRIVAHGKAQPMPTTMAPSTVRDILSGRRQASMNTVNALAAILEVTPEERSEWGRMLDRDKRA